MPHTLRLNRAALMLALTLTLTIGPAATVLANIPAAGDYDEWTRLEIEEAFVTRKTTLQFQDGFGTPEFGWRIARDGQALARGELYATLYYPGPPDSPVDFSLAELDVFYDDTVATRRLIPGQTRVEFAPPGDFAVIRREAFQPDARSGADRRRTGARQASGDVADSVSFLEGDYTDYIALPPESSAFILSSASNIDLSAPDAGALTLYPLQLKIRRTLIADSARGGLLRVRGPIGAGKTDYALWLATGANRKQRLVDSVLLKLTQGQIANDRFLLQEAGDRLLEYAPQESRRACRAQSANPPSDASAARAAREQICARVNAGP